MHQQFAVPVIQMRKSIIVLILILAAEYQSTCQGSEGTFTSIMGDVSVTFFPDSVFSYVSSGPHPTFYRWEDFSEKGTWSTRGDTILINPHLPGKEFVETEFIEGSPGYDSTLLLLTFNHIRRYFDHHDQLYRADTQQIQRLDYAFNTFDRNNLTRVAPNRTTRCFFAGFIPKEVITAQQTISVKKPAEKISSIFIGCYELQGTRKFIISDPFAGHLILNVYSNYYLNGQLRQLKFLRRGKNLLYTRQKENGRFMKDGFAVPGDAILRRARSNSWCWFPGKTP